MHRRAKSAVQLKFLERSNLPGGGGRRPALDLRNGINDKRGTIRLRNFGSLQKEMMDFIFIINLHLKKCNSSNLHIMHFRTQFVFYNCISRDFRGKIWV